jgi:hypothetical protein
MLNKQRAKRYMFSNTLTRSLALMRDLKREATMTANSDRESAKIYQFPARGRFAVNLSGETTGAATPTSQHVVKVAVGSGWYHDAAIQEEERAHKN